MPGKMCVSLSYAKDNADKATVAFVIANAAVASDKDTVVFLSIEGVRMAEKGYADDMHEEGFSPLKELITNFAAAGRQDLGVLAVLQQAQARSERARSRAQRSSAAPSSWSS